MLELSNLITQSGKKVLDIDGTIPVIIWLEHRLKELNIQSDQQLGQFVEQRLTGGLTENDLRSIENQKLMGDLKYCSMNDFIDYTHEILSLVANQLNLSLVSSDEKV